MVNKNVYVVIASHGEYAAGIVSALKLLVDANVEVVSLCAYCGDINNTADVIDNLSAHARVSLQDNREFVVFADIFGGSVANSALMLMASYPHMHVVAGVTLAMMVEFFLSDGENLPIRSRIYSALEASREASVYLNGSEQLTKKNNSVSDCIEKDFF
nr:PTS fructose transporter subunit IIA [Buttiauxella sp. W03-F01]